MSLSEALDLLRKSPNIASTLQQLSSDPALHAFLFTMAKGAVSNMTADKAPEAKNDLANVFRHATDFKSVLATIAKNPKLQAELIQHMTTAVESMSASPIMKLITDYPQQSTAVHSNAMPLITEYPPEYL